MATNHRQKSKCGISYTSEALLHIIIINIANHRRSMRKHIDCKKRIDTRVSLMLDHTAFLVYSRSCRELGAGSSLGSFIITA